MGGIGTKRLFVLLLTVLFCFLLTGCNFEGAWLRFNEKENFNKLANDFVSALENKDKDVIRNMFSEHVRAENYNLDEQIDKLIEAYSRPTERIIESARQSSDSNEHGTHITSAVGRYLLVSADEYYRIEFDWMYVNDVDETQEGLTRVTFYTVEEYYYRYQEIEETGIHIFNEMKAPFELRVIEGGPYKYTPRDIDISIDRVLDFLKDNDNFSDFMDRFGRPNAQDVLSFYELPSENGEPRYLKMCVETDNSVSSVCIVSDTEYIETLWEAEEE